MTDAALSQEAKDFCAQQTSPNTQQAYEYDLKCWFEFLQDRTPTREIAIEYRRWLERRYLPRTAARRFNTVRSYLRWAGGDNVLQSVKSPPRLRNATPAIPSNGVVDALRSGARDARDSAVIALLENGLRASEVAGLRPDDFVWSPEYGCHVIRVRGKGNKERLVPALAGTSIAVSRHLTISKRGSAWLLPALRGNQPMTRRQVTEVLRRAAKTAGIPAVNPHALRHAYATKLIRSGANVLAVQKLLGHESVVTTQVYVQLDLADVVQASKLLDERKVSEDYTYTGAAGRIAPERSAGAGEGRQGFPRSAGPIQ